MLEHQQLAACIQDVYTYYLPVSPYGVTTVTVVNDLNRTMTRFLQTVSGSRASSLSQVSFDSYDICDFKTQVL